MAAHGFVAFFFESFPRPELDARAAFRLGSIQAGTLQIVGTILDMGAKLFFHVIGDLRTMKKSGERDSYLLRPGGKGSGHGRGQAIPTFGLFAKSFAAGGGELVELGAAIVF